MLLASKSNSKLFYFSAVLYISSIDSTVVREVISYSFVQCLHEFLNIYVFGYNVAEARCKRFPINIIISLGRYLLNKYTFVKYTFFPWIPARWLVKESEGCQWARGKVYHRKYTGIGSVGMLWESAYEGPPSMTLEKMRPRTVIQIFTQLVIGLLWELMRL